MMYFFHDQDSGIDQRSAACMILCLLISLPIERGVMEVSMYYHAGDGRCVDLYSSGAAGIPENPPGAHG